MTVTQYIFSVSGVSLLTDYPHGRVTVYGCTVRSPLTGCQVTSRPHDRFPRYSKWLDTLWTALLFNIIGYFFFFQALNYLVESIGLLSDLSPFPPTLDADHPLFDLHLANVLFNIILPSVLGSSL
jgi:hypothetical protein